MRGECGFRGLKRKADIRSRLHEKIAAASERPLFCNAADWGKYVEFGLLNRLKEKRLFVENMWSWVYLKVFCLYVFV